MRIRWEVSSNGTPGDDTIVGTALDDLLEGLEGNDLILGAGGRDSLDGGEGNDTLMGGRRGDELSGWLGDDLLSGGAGDDYVHGGPGADTLRGGDGADALFAHTGQDRVYGGAGDDEVYEEDQIRDTFDGGSGEDTFNGDWRDDTEALIADLRGDPGGTVVINGNTLSGFEYYDLILGKGNDQVYVGGSGRVHGGDGDDLLQGSRLVGGAGNDSLRGTAQGDFFFDDAGNDHMHGYGGDDALLDSVGLHNLLNGGDGDDRLTYNYQGGGRMIGGEGADTFQTVGKLARVMDFVAGVDMIAIFRVGNDDRVIDDVAVVAGPGGFSNTAEMVFVTSDVASFDEEAAAAAIGGADAAYESGDRCYFVLDDGTDSAVYMFQSLQNNAQVSAAELHLLAVIEGHSELQVDNFSF